MVSFGQAISTCFNKYCTFTGRARRSEFWFWTLFVCLLSMVVAVLVGAAAGFDSGAYHAITGLVGLFFLLPNLAVTFRRLHDVGRSGWWWLIAFVPCVGVLILLYFELLDSQPQANQYGPSPKYV